MKFISFATLIFMVLVSCGRQPGNLPKGDARDLPGDKSATTRSYNGYHTLYEYSDSSGKAIAIKNSFPKGELYTAPNGKKYVKAIFWTQIENNTDRPLDLVISFLGDSYNFLDSAGAVARSYKLMVPPDTMRLDRVGLVNFGLSDIGAFVSESLGRPTSLKRTISPGGSTGVYVIRLFIMDNEASGKPKSSGGGVTRAGFSLKGKQLIYTLNGKEFPAGRINLENLALKNYRKVGI